MCTVHCVLKFILGGNEYYILSTELIKGGHFSNI
jgi:hypothetical protein